MGDTLKKSYLPLGLFRPLSSLVSPSLWFPHTVFVPLGLASQEAGKKEIAFQGYQTYLFSEAVQTTRVKATQISAIKEKLAESGFGQGCFIFAKLRLKLPLWEDSPHCKPAAVCPQGREGCARSWCPKLLFRPLCKGLSSASLLMDPKLEVTSR